MEVENQHAFVDGAVEAPSMGGTVSGSEPERESVVLRLEQWAAVAQWRFVADQLRVKFPKLGALLGQA